MWKRVNISALNTVFQVCQVFSAGVGLGACTGSSWGGSLVEWVPLEYAGCPPLDCQEIGTHVLLVKLPPPQLMQASLPEAHSLAAIP